jgi:homoisocitrate dehydrogenase
MNEPHRLCVIPGDGVGKEVIPAAVAVLRDVIDNLEIVEADAGWETFRQTGTALPPETLDAARDCESVLFGAVASPTYPVEGYRSPIVALRRALDVFANIRPLKGWPISTAHPSLDLVVVRENTEGLYGGKERLEGDTAISERVITKAGSRRIARVAFELARPDRRWVTIVHKANVIRIGDGLWRSTCLEVAADYPDVETDEGIVDAVAYHLVRDPGRYNLLLCPNLYGDILSDLGAGLGGGLGMAPSLSLGDQYAIAEPTHGAAPDIAGQGIANPIGAILSGALLARHRWQRPDAADAIEAAIRQVLEEGLRTPDIAGPGEPTVGTEAMTAAVQAALR